MAKEKAMDTNQLVELTGFKNVRAHRSSFIDVPVQIGEGTTIWHFCHIREHAKIGRNCSFGHACYVDKEVIVGDNVRVQNHVNLYKGVILEDDVFIGPSVTFTNVRKPRSFKRTAEENYEVTLVKHGVSIGANAVILCGVTIGEYAMIGCGAVVNRNIPPYSLAVGNPAKVIKDLREGEEK